MKAETPLHWFLLWIEVWWFTRSCRPTIFLMTDLFSRSINNSFEHFPSVKTKFRLEHWSSFLESGRLNSARRFNRRRPSSWNSILKVKYARRVEHIIMEFSKEQTMKYQLNKWTHLTHCLDWRMSSNDNRVRSADNRWICGWLYHNFCRISIVRGELMYLAEELWFVICDGSFHGPSPMCAISLRKSLSSSKWGRRVLLNGAIEGNLSLLIKSFRFQIQPNTELGLSVRHRDFPVVFDDIPFAQKFVLNNSSSNLSPLSQSPINYHN